MSSVDCTVSITHNIPRPDAIKDQAATQASSIIAQVKNLQEQADQFNGVAKGLVEGLSAFEVAVDDIEYDFEIGDYTREGLDGRNVPSVYRAQNIQSGSFDAPPEVNVDDFDISEFDPPPEFQGAEFPDAPDLEGAGPLPQEVDLSQIPEIDDAPPPEYDLIQGMPEMAEVLAKLDPLSMDFPYVDFFERAEFCEEGEDLDVCWAELPLPDESLMDRYPGAVRNRNFLLQYDEVIAWQAVAAATLLLDGDYGLTEGDIDDDGVLADYQRALAFINKDFVVDMESLALGVVRNHEQAVDEYRGRVRSIWTRRGQHDFRAGVVRDHVDSVRRRVEADAKADFQASLIRWRMQLLPKIIQLNVEAHTMLVDKLTQTLDLEFEMIAAQKEAQIGMFAYVAERYRLAVSKLMKQVGRYNREIAAIRTRLLKYTAFVEREKAKARLNKTLAEGYSTYRKMKMAETEDFFAHIRELKIKLEAYSDQMRGLEAQAQALGVEITKFEAETAEWQANVAEVRNEYQLRRAENQIIVSENRAAAAKVSAEATDASVLGEQATQSAAVVAAEAAKLRAVIASRLGETLSTEADNTRNALEYRNETLGYRLDAADRNAALLEDLVDYAAIESNNSAISRVVSGVVEPISRAAQLTQQYQTQAAEAYIQLARTAADAEAARLSGEAGRFRASTALAARGDIRHNSRISRQTNMNYARLENLSWNCRTIFREARM